MLTLLYRLKTRCTRRSYDQRGLVTMELIILIILGIIIYFIYKRVASAQQ